MRTPLGYALAAIVILLLGSTVVLFTKYQKTSADYAQMKVSEETTRSKYANTIDAIAEIQDSLNAISAGEGGVKMLSENLQAERGLSAPNGREALDRIELLRASILRNKERIVGLEANLKKSGNKVAGLQKMINQLKQSVTEKEELVAQLTTQVDSLQTQVTGLTADVQQKQETIVAKDQTLEERRRELATIYYVVGSKKDLTHSGVVVAKGGVLGLGKTLQPTGVTHEETFIPLDTDQETIVRTEATKVNQVRVLSAQPPSSYELRLVDGKTELHILDPQQFRKVKQLVILTA